MMVAMPEFNKSPAAFMMFLFHLFVFLSKLNFSCLSGDDKGVAACPTPTCSEHGNWETMTLFLSIYLCIWLF